MAAAIAGTALTLAAPALRAQEPPPSSPRAVPPGVAYDVAPPDNIIGMPRIHRLERRQTLLDVARRYGLGFNEIQDLYPQWDPWIPPFGVTMVIPCRWILPGSRRDGIVVNLAELRLYYFDGFTGQVITFPVGIGDREFQSPAGVFVIGEKQVHPVWSVPPSLHHKYGRRSMPPGPDNPLGDFWMGLAGTRYGIHGTDCPWSVGRLVTHGCIRMYPEDIALFFRLVPSGTRVEIVYEPVKIGMLSGKVFVEAHPDIYAKSGSLSRLGEKLLRSRNLEDAVHRRLFYQALEECRGMPVDVTRTRR